MYCYNDINLLFVSPGLSGCIDTKNLENRCRYLIIKAIKANVISALHLNSVPFTKNLQVKIAVL
jgi:hypothetical protein